MTDREEFEKWFGKDTGYKSANKELYGKIKEAMFSAWQARGELDAVRIKELEIQNALYAADEFKATTECIVMQATIAQLQKELDK